MSSNFPGSRVDPSEDTTDGGQTQVDPSEDEGGEQDAADEGSPS